MMPGTTSTRRFDAEQRTRRQCVVERGLAGRGRRDHGSVVVVARNLVLVRRQPLGIVRSYSKDRKRTSKSAFWITSSPNWL